VHPMISLAELRHQELRADAARARLAAEARRVGRARYLDQLRSCIARLWKRPMKEPPGSPQLGDPDAAPPAPRLAAVGPAALERELALERLELGSTPVVGAPQSQR
jgi:hypothetical protein